MTPFLPSAQNKQVYGEHLDSPVCMHFGQAQNAVCASAHMQRTMHALRILAGSIFGALRILAGSIFS